MKYQETTSGSCLFIYELLWRCISVCLERLRLSDSKGALSEGAHLLQTFRFMLYDKVEDEETVSVCVLVLSKLVLFICVAL